MKGLTLAILSVPTRVGRMASPVGAGAQNTQKGGVSTIEGTHSSVSIIMPRKIGTSLRVFLAAWFISTAQAFEPGCIKVAPDYQLQKVMATAFGLPFQIALLPNDNLVETDPNNQRIILLRDQTVIAPGKAWGRGMTCGSRKRA